MSSMRIRSLLLSSHVHALINMVNLHMVGEPNKKSLQAIIRKSEMISRALGVKRNCQEYKYDGMQVES